MIRTLDVNKPDMFNKWVWQSIRLFAETSYLDDIREVYPFGTAVPQKMEPEHRRSIIHAHGTRDVDALFRLLRVEVRFPYDDPMWYLLKNVKHCSERNPEQFKRIAQSLFLMTAEEAVTRLEAPPKINTQIGPMFRDWLRREYTPISPDDFVAASTGIYVLDASEEEGKAFVRTELGQDLDKRPDLVGKVGRQYVIGEAKWIGQPGGNQEKQVQETIQFCKQQRGDVRRIGIVDGFPWALRRRNEGIIGSKEAVLIQESEYDVMSALLINDYFRQFC